MIRSLVLAVAAVALHAAAAAQAQPAFALYGQSTVVWQRKPSFDAAYSGAHSLSPRAEDSHSFTATLSAGLRPWAEGEAWLEAEAVQGAPMSDLTGLGGLTNGELQKTAGATPKGHLSRAFVRHSWALDGERDEEVEGRALQLAGGRPARRVTLTAGMLAVTDLFDDNAFAHDPRTQFLNWAFLTHGHYDYAADARGYSRGLALEWTGERDSLRIGRFMVPSESNGTQLERALGRYHGDQIEWERRWRAGPGAGNEGALRLMAFRNVARMARFDDALAAAAPGAPPALDGVRRRQAKTGWGCSLEQALPRDAGVFMRLGRHDGATEPYSFTSVDRAASAGVTWRGAAWGREDDRVGLALARHGLSPSHRRFLAAGGADFFIGDGALRYGAEQVAEAIYTAVLARGVELAFDAQHIARPAYNRDRGPVQAFGLRLHVEH